MNLFLFFRNALYNISLPNLVENTAQRLEWSSSEAHRELCTLKGKQDLDCQNYIRVYARVDRNKIMVCGTNSYKPLCRYYKEKGTDDSPSDEVTKSESIEVETVDEQQDEGVVSRDISDDIKDENNLTFSEASNSSPFELVEESDGQGRCPYNPLHNSSFIYTGELSVADLATNSNLIRV